ncbi:MAG TPA: hypothetical protein VLB85_10210 [Acidimicrobiia bacterium]|nr:hypothetical protein [Acidimicrobiia bacterium]
MSRRQLQAAGVSRNAVRHRVESGILVARGPQALVLAGSPVLAAQDAMVAVLDAPPGAMLSHRSAAAWWGIPGFDLSGRLEVVIPRRGAVDRHTMADWHFQFPLPGGSARTLRGICVTSAPLTLLHLGAVCPPGRVRRALNNALARHLVTMDEVWAARKQFAGSGRNGVGVLGEVLAEFGDGYVPADSSVELRLAEIGDAYGVPLERQVWVGDDERRIGRADFRLKAEPDGLVELLSFTYHSMFLDRLSDEVRFARMERAGFEVLQIWDTDVWNRPDEVAHTLIDFSMRLAAKRVSP